MKRLFVLMSAVALLAGTSFGLVSFEYDAGPAGGGPANLDPVLQGWTPTEVDTNAGPLQNVFFLQPDGGSGYNATQLNDQHGSNATPSPNDNPGYGISLTAQNFQDMYDNGWEYESQFKMVQGAGFSGWGWSGATGGPIWGTGGSRDRFGFGLSIGTNNNVILNSQDGLANVDLGADSVDTYHTILAVGITGSSLYEIFIDGVSYGNDDLTLGGSNSASDNRVLWQSGSSNNGGRVVNWNQVRLTVVPEPSTVALLGLGLGAMLLRRRRA